MSAERSPLSWPAGWKRTPAHARRPARFHGTATRSYGSGNSYRVKTDLTVGQAIDRLRLELHRLGVADDDWLISSNVEVRLDGLPYSNRRAPDDPGVAVYFRLNRKDRCLACDTWRSVADNIAAIAGHIDAIRRIDRYGVGTLDQAFAGYQALPPKGETWRSTLGFGPDDAVDADRIEAAFRQRARVAHPDAGGSHDAMAALTAARDHAREALGL